MIYGADYLGGLHFEKAMLKTHPQGWSAGIFLNTFGDAHKTVRKMAASGKFSEIVVHLAPFDNDHGYPIEVLKRMVLQEAQWLNKLALEFRSVVFLLSPFCEHNHGAAKMKKFFTQIQKVAPDCLMLNSIWKGDPIPGIITEIHLENSKLKKKPKGEYTVSFDGFGGDGTGDFPDTDIPEIIKHYSDARHIRLWNFRYNGKYAHKTNDGKPWPPPPKRKFWPDEKYLRGHNAMMKEREGPVATSFKHLYKPFSDDHGQGGKDNKAMVITSKKASLLNVFDVHGNKIDTMTRVLPDHSNEPKGPRYYSSKCAYEIADIAEKNTGSRRIKVDNQPLTDGDLRSGRFR